MPKTTSASERIAHLASIAEAERLAEEASNEFVSIVAQLDWAVAEFGRLENAAMHARVARDNRLTRLCRRREVFQKFLAETGPAPALADRLLAGTPAEMAVA